MKESDAKLHTCTLRHSLLPARTLLLLPGVSLLGSRSDSGV
jgi:hypothetical protein